MTSSVVPGLSGTPLPVPCSGSVTVCGPYPFAAKIGAIHQDRSRRDVVGVLLSRQLAQHVGAIRSHRERLAAASARPARRQRRRQDLGGLLDGLHVLPAELRAGVLADVRRNRFPIEIGRQDLCVSRNAGHGNGAGDLAHALAAWKQVHAPDDIVPRDQEVLGKRQGERALGADLRLCGPQGRDKNAKQYKATRQKVF